jgi:hypothetical protein
LASDPQVPIDEPARASAPAAPRLLRGRVKVHDPFELVRWLALSQPDPRKALAELVQNSLDAGARHVVVTRRRDRGVPALHILDDGEGVIPELDRAEALRYVATHIGHSRKRRLSPQERLRLMTQGQYGIGLLGFWSLGETLEVRTSVPGQRPHRLVLYRDSPEFLIEPMRGRSLYSDLWTEVVVGGLRPEATPALVARRAADFLAAELRGQLLARDVELILEDRIGRGLAEKRVRVRPRRFLGERLVGLDGIEVPGRPSIRLELHLAPGEDATPIAIYAAGTQVAESFHELAALQLDHPPWTDRRLTGLVDFPGLTVAPGSRRGVVPDAAASAFVRALRGVEPLLAEALEQLELRRTAELDRKLVRDLQRAFRGLFHQQPRYTLLPLASGGRAEGPAGSEGEAIGETTSALTGAEANSEASEAGAVDADDLGAPEPPATELPFPHGPLAEVTIEPSPVRLYRGAWRRVRARGLDAGGRPALGPVTYHWQAEGTGILLEGVVDGEPRVTVRAGVETGNGSVRVVASAVGGHQATAMAEVIVRDEPGPGRSSEGIPEPELVDFPGAPWRSRLLADRWQVNSAHPEYQAIRDSPTLKLRYLALLFAKEVVLRSSQDPRLDAPLEQLVEIASFADRNLGRRRRRDGEREE